MATAARIYWNRLDEASKEKARELIGMQNGQALIQLLRKKHALHSGGCNCNVTPDKVLFNAKMAMKRKMI